MFQLKIYSNKKSKKKQ